MREQVISVDYAGRLEVCMSQDLAETPLHAWHAGHDGSMVDFAGWSMPVQYEGIVAEHQATRTAATLFDVSHMGRFRFSGSRCGEFLDSLTTRRVKDMAPGQIRYSLMCKEDGGILDDVLVYYLPEAGGAVNFSMVVNAGNRLKIAAWIQQHLVTQSGVEFEDQTLATSMIALQGPRAVEIADQLAGAKVSSMKYYTGANTTFAGVDAGVSRTGYTGEDGCEIVVANEHAVAVWEKLLETGAAAGIRAAGLGARDSLRLEAAMPLYGHELSEQINPLQAGLKFAVNLKDRQFAGRDAIAAARNNADTPVRIGLEMQGRRVPREHYTVHNDQQQVGEVTSGGYSPTLQKSIAMAYVSPQAAAVGSTLQVDIRGRREAATVVSLPFYKR